jgi:hypothetical protein
LTADSLLRILSISFRIYTFSSFAKGLYKRCTALFILPYMPLYSHYVECLCKALHGSVQPFTGFYIHLCRYGCKSSL